MFKGRNILVTGGQGFIGRNLVTELVKRGANVRATLHQRNSDNLLDKVEYVKADLTVKKDCQAVVQEADCVFMCAANTSGAAVITNNPLAHVTPNVVMNTFMLDAAYHAKVQKFVFISSSIVYPDTGTKPSLEEEAFIGDPYEPYFSAGWMKRYGELLCRTYSEKLRNPMTTVVVRPSNVYGPFDKFDFERAHVTASLIRKVMEGRDPLDVWGTGEDIRDLIFIDDFLEGLLLATERLNSFATVNIASGRGYKVKKILDAIIRVVGRGTPQVIFDPSKPSMVPIRLLNIEKAKSLLGFFPKTTLEEGLRKTVHWYQTYYGHGSQGIHTRKEGCSSPCEKAIA